MSKWYIMAMWLPVLTTTPPDFSNFTPIVIINVIKALFIAIVGGIGAIVIIKNGMELGNAIQNTDSAGISSALKGLAGGGIMAGISMLVGWFGF